MTDTVIRAESLGKRYTLGRATSGKYRTLRDSLTEAVQAPWRRLRAGAGTPALAADEEFWALRDVSFEIHPGEVVGIIGRNGAGKSTLLKVLSRITEPSTGRIALKGRVASLLEVGTGFHPELTGRENIFLNGAILGMSRVEIKAKFDEIVAFAEVEKFLDTPVKRYSSGMYVRLAFAVAAHLEPEILIVDEVLAVGDAQFQKKCLGKMQDVSKQDGRTVLFVSHQMSAVESLCSRVVVLNKGSVAFNGESKPGLTYYLNDLQTRVSSGNVRTLRRTGSGVVQIIGFTVLDAAGVPLNSISSGDEIKIALNYERDPAGEVNHLNVGISIHNQHGDTLSVFYSEYAGHHFAEVPLHGQVTCTIRDFPFSEGRYFVGARVVVNGVEADWPQEFVGALDVAAGDFYGAGAVGQYSLGPLLLRGTWQINSNPQL